MTFNNDYCNICFVVIVYNTNDFRPHNLCYDEKIALESYVKVLDPPLEISNIWRNVTFAMNTSTKPLHLPHTQISSLLHWKNIAVVAAAILIAVSYYRFMDTLHSGAVVAYLLYPASIGCVALLLYTRVYLRYPEVRLYGAFFIWMLIVIVLNMNRADGALSSGWFYSLCATSFLGFSLPYAFESAEQPRVVSFLAWVTVLLSGALSAPALYFVATGRVLEMHSGIEGTLGIGADNRLWMFCHPNSAAPICGIGVLLSVYLFAISSRKRLRFFLLIPFVLCAFSLALTDSRAGILATVLALGLEVFFILAARCFRTSKQLRRTLFSLVLAVACMALFYQGNIWVRQGYNTLATQAETGTSVDAATTEPAPDAVETTLVQPASTEISNRDLSDFSNFNGRTAIWRATLRGLLKNPSILITGATPLMAGPIMTPYFPKEAPYGNFHNSFFAVLVSFGLPGLFLMLAFLVYLFVRGLRLIVHSLFDERLLPARLLISILVFGMGESMMEQFLFVDGMPSVVWVWFVLATGFTFCSAREALPASDA